MIVTQKILDELSAKAKDSPWFRMAMDLRNSPEDFIRWRRMNYLMWQRNN